MNDTLRRGPARPPASAPRQPFKVHVRDLGRLRLGLSLDNIGALLDQIEGPLHR